MKYIKNIKHNFELGNKKYKSFFNSKDVIKVFKQYNRTMWNGECIYDSSSNEYTYSGLIKFNESELKVKQIDKIDLILNEIQSIKLTVNNIYNRIDNLEKRMDSVEISINQIDIRLSKIENCPTIKKELGKVFE